MKAYEIQPREGFASLTKVDRAAPGTLGPLDVRVRVHAVSLNFRDLAIAKNAASRKKPVVPCSDGAGEVIEVGSAVRRWKKGDQVAANFFPTWKSGPYAAVHQEAALGGSVDGMFAEEVVLGEDAWVKIPKGYSLSQAATLPCAAVTAWNGLFVATTTRPGDRVLVQGTGGVSIFALQLAHAAGAEVLATSSSAEKRARLETMGASKTIDYKATPAWGEAVQAATGGRGVHTVIEVGGAGTFDESAKALAYNGTMSMIGVLSGIKAPIATNVLLSKALTVRGIYVGSVAMFEDLVAALERNRIEPVIDRTFTFDDALAAYEHVDSGAHFGKVVITI